MKGAALLYKLMFLYVQYGRQLARAKLAGQSPLHQLAAQGE